MLSPPFPVRLATAALSLLIKTPRIIKGDLRDDHVGLTACWHRRAEFAQAIQPRHEGPLKPSHLALLPLASASRCAKTAVRTVSTTLIGPLPMC